MTIARRLDSIEEYLDIIDTEEYEVFVKIAENYHDFFETLEDGSTYTKDERLYNKWLRVNQDSFGLGLLELAYTLSDWEHLTCIINSTEAITEFIAIPK